jgi:hypothetical protein
MGRLFSLRVAVAAAALAVIGTTGHMTTAQAYGKADQPLAQLSVSANCDNASFSLCQPSAVGLGGIWFWIEIDSNPPGTGDMSGAACGHTVGGGGPHQAGASSIKGSVSWSYSTLANGLAAGAVFFGTTDPNNNYYLVTLTIGEKWLIPTTTGHYQVRLATGVQIQMNVAP